MTLGDLPNGAYFQLDGKTYRKQERVTNRREGYYAFGIQQGEGFQPARLIHLSCKVEPIVDEQPN